jgi:microcystin-dependent protein
MALPFFNWSRTAANNATADSTVNWSEGQAPSTVNDSARAMMASTAAYRDDTAGAITTGGTSTAYTLTSYQVFDTLAHLHGQVVALVPNVTSGAAPTLAVDGLTAKGIRFAPGIDLPAGTLIQGTPYIVTYNNSDGYFYLRNYFGNSPLYLPIGGIIPYAGSTAPNSNFALCNSQTISRSTYATLFALVSTTFGVGDGSTTFGLPDLRGRVIAGLDNMGGIGTIGRITNAGSGITGTTIGATGGAQNETLSQSNLPTNNYTPAGTISTTVSYTNVNSGNLTAFNFFMPQSGTPNATGVTSTFTGTSTNIGGSGTAFAIMPPTIILPYIMRVA